MSGGRHRAQPPLFELACVGRSYGSGGARVHALAGVDLSIQAGEMVAIMGPSGSGKSTLMHLLGTLERPSSGQLRIDGVAVDDLDLQGLARLRRERFGFMFQRYHLIAGLDAQANVGMPAVYAGLPSAQRRRRAAELLAQLGLDQRLSHRPSELSGGQQQRVSLARALMNGGPVILADEPTGALDSRSGAEVMQLLVQLHQCGHTVIIVTHDPAVAAHAQRIIELRDGRILSDSGTAARAPSQAPAAAPQVELAGQKRWAWLARVGDGIGQALHGLKQQRLRTGLSTLGIAIGIAAVVAVIALGQAIGRSMEQALGDLLSNRLTVMSGSADDLPGQIPRVFKDDDLRPLRSVAGVVAVRPILEQALTARQARRSASLTAIGMTPADFAAEGHTLQLGRGLSEIDRQLRSQAMVLTAQAVEQLFEPGQDPLGATVLLGMLPFTVVGVSGDSVSGANGLRSAGFIADTTMVVKILGHGSTDRFHVYTAKGADPRPVQQALTRQLLAGRDKQDFTIYNQAEQFEQASDSLRTVQQVLAGIAGVSLLVGGVGIMNMMLVAVSERTAEIGIRMAVGARPEDVQLQFLIEAMVLCLLGGLLGLLFSGGLIAGVHLLWPVLKLSWAWTLVLPALAVSLAIGLCFGYIPARLAARLSPVDALARG